MIEIRNVTKRFGRVTALDGVTLSIGAGEKLAFVGANGSGKTTLLRAVLGLVRVDGEVAIAGVDVAKRPEVALRQVAYIPQIAPPIEAPVFEVVRATAALRGASDDATWACARRLGLDVDVARPKRFRDLSGGMKQKLLAAMALAAAAPVLVCDEPTANLDGDARAAFLELLAERPRGSVVVLCSHRVEEVHALVDRVVELSDGRVRRDVPLEEMLAERRAYRIEVLVRPEATRTTSALRHRGFASAGPGRLAIDVSQIEKLALVTWLLAEHGADVADLGVAPIEDLAHAHDVPRLMVAS